MTMAGAIVFSRAGAGPLPSESRGPLGGLVAVLGERGSS
jgi:hypothetical protein